MSRYLPVCDYIDSKLDFIPRGSGVLVSTVSLLGINLAVHKAFNVASMGAEYVLPSIAGFLLAGGVVEKQLPPVLNKAGVGVTKGGVILRGSQLAAASLPLALSIGIQINRSPSLAPIETEPLPEAVMEPISALSGAPCSLFASDYERGQLRNQNTIHAIDMAYRFDPV